MERNQISDDMTRLSEFVHDMFYKHRSIGKFAVVKVNNTHFPVNKDGTPLVEKASFRDHIFEVGSIIKIHPGKKLNGMFDAVDYRGRAHFIQGDKIKLI